MAEINNDAGAEFYNKEHSRVTRNTVTGKQSNHGDFHLPACLAHLTDPPLYLAVSYWGLLTGGGLSRAIVSETFRISERRAADVMSYISRERCDVIDCVRKITREGKGRRGLILTITAVRVLVPAPSSPPVRRRKVQRPGAADMTRELRHWFLRKPNLSSAG